MELAKSGGLRIIGPDNREFVFAEVDELVAQVIGRRFEVGVRQHLFGDDIAPPRS